MMSRPLVFIGFVGSVAALSLFACGSRTGLFEDEERAPDANRPDVVDAGPPDVPFDALEGAPADVSPADVPADIPTDVPPDAPRADVGPPDAPPTPCTSNAQCDNGVACDVNACDLVTGTCTHTPDDALCSAGFVCQPPCMAASFAEDPSTLYGVSLPAGGVMSIGPTTLVLDDIALDPSGTLYGVGDGNVYTVDTKTGAVKTATPLSYPGFLNALDFAPDGTLYAAGGNTLFTIDPATGVTAEVATYPAPYASSGDLAVIGTQLFATVTGDGTTDSLLFVDLTTFSVTVVGPTGYVSIWGLAAYGTQLFGYTDSGHVLQIDPTTAKSTLLASTGIGFYGASAR
jgi:hypothetical protein